MIRMSSKPALLGLVAALAWTGSGVAQTASEATLADEPALPDVTLQDPAAGARIRGAVDGAGQPAGIPGSPSRLRTPIDQASIEQRIDKGLSAAGVASAIPPDLAYGAFQRGYFLTAFSLALDRATAGDATAQTLLGELLSRGLGVKQDLAAAADWYGLAGKGGDDEALYALGRMYLEGRGVEQDFATAADLFEEAAKKDHSVAAREFAYLLLQGKGRETNAMLGAAYMRRAADGGDMDAQFALGGLFAEGVGIVANDAEAVRWFGEAARNGHVGAQIEYAIMLFNGRGIAANEAVAARWFREAAQAGNPVAQVRLARILAEGRGLDADAAAAARWYLIARNQGFEDDRLESWLYQQDPQIRSEAESAAEFWARNVGLPPAAEKSETSAAITEPTPASAVDIPAE